MVEQPEIATLDSFRGLLSPVRDSAGQMSEEDRRILSLALRKLATDLESPTDTIFRVANSPLELYVSQVGVDTGLFEYLTKAGKPVKLDELIQFTKADPLLLGRICRFLASYNVIEETDVDEYAASNVTKTLTDPSRQAGLAHHLFMNKALEQIPGWLKDSDHRNMDDPKDCAFSRANHTKRVLFDWIQDHPKDVENFGKFLEKYQKSKVTFTDVVPWVERCRGWTGERPLFVDVGGYFGAQTTQFRDAVAPLGIPGRIILQDLEGTLAKSPELPPSSKGGVAIEKMAIDFFADQPVAGAKFYYLRHVLHDHKDERSLVILRHIAAQMAPDSVLLVNDQVIPDRGAHPHSTSSDMVMMSMVAALERTRSQWSDLLETKAGLKITAVHTCDPFSSFSVIECVKP